MDIWNLVDESAGLMPVRSRSRFSGLLFSVLRFLIAGDDDEEAYGGREAISLSLIRRSLELHRNEYLEPINAEAVLSECRNEVYKAEGISNTTAECAICLEGLVANDDLLRLPCNHRFHSECVIPWIKSKHKCCPSCRDDIRAARAKMKAAKGDDDQNST